MEQSAKKHGAVLVLASSYPMHLGESSSVFVHYLSRYLVQEGWEIIVLVPNFPEGSPQEVMQGVKVRRFNYFFPRWQHLCYGSGVLTNLRRNPGLWLQVPFFLVAMALQASRLLRTCKINLVHAHWILPQGLVASVLRWWFKVPVVLTAHGGDAFAFQRGLPRQIKKACLKASVACTVNSRYTQKVIQEGDVQCPVDLIPMGVDTVAFSPAEPSCDLRKSLGIEGEMVLFVGRLVEKKGARFLVDAWPAVRKQFPKAVLVMVGEGVLRSELESRVAALGVGNSIRFTGRLSNEILPDYYRSADLFVGPSIVDQAGDTEGLGVVFLEAMATGTPVVGTAAGGSSDLLQHERTGLVVHPNDSGQLAEAILRLLKDSQLRRSLSETAREQIVYSYSWGQVASGFSSLFLRVIDQSTVR
jgi:glycosyltransferase involved in cell wall biosynthesis